MVFLLDKFTNLVAQSKPPFSEVKRSLCDNQLLNPKPEQLIISACHYGILVTAG